MTRLIVVVVLGVATVCGCKSKELSKDEALKLLDNTLYAEREIPQCTVWVGEKYSNGKFNFVGDEKCLKLLKEHRAISDYERRELGTYWVSLANQSVSCETKLGREICRARFDCGTAKATIDSVTTENRQASVRYTLRRHADDWIGAAPTECLVKVDYKDFESREFAAVLDDEGSWSMKK